MPSNLVRQNKGRWLPVASLLLNWLLFVLLPLFYICFAVAGGKAQFLWMLIPQVCYLAGQFLRAVRLWIILQSQEFSLKEIIQLHFLAYASANFLPLPAKEVFTLYLIGKKDATLVFKGILAVVFARLFDFIILSAVVIVLVMSGYKSATLLVGAFIVAVLLLLTGFFLLPGIIDFLNRFLAVRTQNKYAPAAIEMLMRLKRGYYGMRLNKLEKGFIVLLISALVWVAEVLSVGIPLAMAFGGTIMRGWRFMVDALMNTSVSATLVNHAIYYPFFIVFWIVAMIINRKVLFSAVSRSV